MSTSLRLVSAAAALLDGGGEAAVTLRAVAAAVGVSHNAPYKHFTNRDDLLVAVAVTDFAALADGWESLQSAPLGPVDRLLSAVDLMVRFSVEHPARYRLLFGSPAPTAGDVRLDGVAEDALRAFAVLVEQCQESRALPASQSDTLAVLLFATVHGLIDADHGGRLRSRTGWTDVAAGVRVLLDLLSRTASDPTGSPSRPSVES